MKYYEENIYSLGETVTGQTQSMSQAVQKTLENNGGVGIMTGSYDQNLSILSVNNLISNIYKYADKKQTVHIQCMYENHHLKLSMQNSVRTTDVQTESNHIGLESVKRVIKLHEGTCCYKIDNNIFMISIEIP